LDDTCLNGRNWQPMAAPKVSEHFSFGLILDRAQPSALGVLWRSTH
jgi:hypothetical protein